jgi:hypothetical protein
VLSPVPRAINIAPEPFADTACRNPGHHGGLADGTGVAARVLLAQNLLALSGPTRRQPGGVAVAFYFCTCVVYFARMPFGLASIVAALKARRVQAVVSPPGNRAPNPVGRSSRIRQGTG